MTTIIALMLLLLLWIVVSYILIRCFIVEPISEEPAAGFVVKITSQQWEICTADGSRYFGSEGRWRNMDGALVSEDKRIELDTIFENNR